MFELLEERLENHKNGFLKGQDNSKIILKHKSLKKILTSREKCDNITIPLKKGLYLC